MNRQQISKAILSGWMAVISICNAVAAVTFTPHPGYPAPNFFSGTNARAFYKAEISFPQMHLSDAELYVGGLKVVTHTYPQYIPGPPPAWSYNIGDWSAVMFDSTLLLHGESIEVTLRVKVDGTWYEDSYSAVSSNLAFLAGLDTIEGTGTDSWGWGTWASKTILTEWIEAVRDITQWDRGDYFYNLNSAAFHHYVGHGNPDVIGDGTHNSVIEGVTYGAHIYFNDADEQVYSVLHRRASAFGESLPPFSMMPALHLAFIQACQTGTTSAKLITYLYPFWNGYEKFLENQAGVGIIPFMKIADYSEVATGFFDKLAAEGTVGQSVQAMVDYCQLQNLEPVKYLATDPYQELELEDIRIVGDEFTTVRGVYTGGNTSSRPFSREIFFPYLD